MPLGLTSDFPEVGTAPEKPVMEGEHLPDLSRMWCGPRPEAAWVPYPADQCTHRVSLKLLILYTATGFGEK